MRAKNAKMQLTLFNLFLVANSLALLVRIIVFEIASVILPVEPQHENNFD